jgi:PAS domain S-box-containing protein
MLYKMNSSLRILYLESDDAGAAFVQDALAKEHIASVVMRVETESEFRAALQHGGFDLILADYALASFDGLSALSIARQQSPDVPFIFVSGTFGEEVAIEALKAGATDYVLKSRLSRLAPSVQRALREATERAELRRSEEARRRSEFYLAEGQRLTRTGSWAFNPAGFFEYWSEELFHIFGLDPKEGAPTLERYLGTVHPQDREAMAETIRRMHAESCGCDVNKRIVRPDGEVRVIRCVGVPVLQNGVLKGFLGTGMDVTDQEHMTQELRRSQAYHSEAQRLTGVGTWAWNSITRLLLHASDECARIYGFGATEEVSFERYYNCTHPEDEPVVRATLESAIRAGAEFDMELRIIRPDGSVRYVRVIGRPFGEAGEYLGSTMDLTDRKHSEEQQERLRRLEADLAHMNRVTTMGELTASLAHEINQPISAAVTDANTCVRWLTRDHPDLEEAREAAKRTVKDATRAADIIRQTRQLFKNRPALHEVVTVNDLITEIIMLVRSEAVRCGVAIRTQLKTDLPFVRGDRTQLQQVLLNLIMNGIEAMKGVDGGRQLTVTSARDGSDQLLVSVADTGTGLPPDQDEIFRAFFTTKPDGTGMGLAISRSIVESHGGRLWATSNTGPGATFCFSLPAAVPAQA